MFIATLRTIVKICKQPKGPLMDEWVRKCGTHTYIYVYLSIYRTTIQL